jgi:hypothetical protein
MTFWMRVLVAGAGVLAAGLLPGAGQAQENIDAGKSAAQLYASDCAICHKSAQALNKSAGGLFGLESFLREHYTASRESAAVIAAYLNSLGAASADHRPARRTRDKRKDASPGGRSGERPAHAPSDKEKDG